MYFSFATKFLIYETISISRFNTTAKKIYGSIRGIDGRIYDEYKSFFERLQKL